MDRAFAFVHFGSFSHANAGLLQALQAEFPAHRADVVDAASLGVLSSAALPRLCWEVVLDYGPLELLGRHRLIGRAVRTRWCFEELGRRVRAKLAGRAYDFTLQTQAMFDAALPSTPHFLYTDHTHLENLRYPGFDRSRLAHRGWIDAEAGAYRSALGNFTMGSNIARSIIRDYGVAPDRAMVAGAGCNAFPPIGAVPDADRFLRKRILFVGVEWERKGGPVLVEAFRRVRAVHPEAELVIVGCSPRLREPGCRVIGRVPVDQVSRFYHSSTVFCLPTRLEPFGLVFVEALAHGLPVVGTSIGAIADFAGEGRTGLLVPPDDPGALAEALDSLLRDPDRCARMGSDGERFAREHYTWSATGARIAAVIRERTGLPLGKAA